MHAMDTAGDRHDSSLESESTHTQVFISYSHKDAKWLEELKRPLKQTDVGAEFWSDQDIKPGSQWYVEIEQLLSHATVAVLLVTPDFLVSDFITKHELEPLLQRAADRCLTILWVPVRAVDLGHLSVSKYQSLSDPARPLALMSKAKREREWVQICRKIEAAVREATHPTLAKSNIVPTTSPPISAVVDRDDAEALWSAGVDRLICAIAASLESNGGFSIALGMPKSGVDVWVTAQAVAAILSVGPQLSEDCHLEAAFTWIQKKKSGRGWCRFRGRDNDLLSTEVTAWVGIAFLAAVSSAHVPEPIRKTLFDEAMAIYHFLVAYQTDIGAWQSFSVESSRTSAAAQCRYSSALALQFLIGLQVSLRQNGDTEPNELKPTIKSGLNCILTQFDHDDAVAPTRQQGGSYYFGLATLNLYILNAAAHAGWNYIDVDRRYTDARRQWSKYLSEHAPERPIADNVFIPQKQEIVDQHGVAIGEELSPAAVFWYPWALLLATRCCLDQKLPAEDKGLATNLRARLWSRFSEAVDTVTVGATSQAAELLLVSGIIAKAHGWLSKRQKEPKDSAPFRSSL